MREEVAECKAFEIPEDDDENESAKLRPFQEQVQPEIDVIMNDKETTQTEEIAEP